MILASSVFRHEFDYGHPSTFELEYEPIHHEEPMKAWILAHKSAESTLKKIAYNLAADWAPDDARIEEEWLSGSELAVFYTWHEADRHVYCCTQVEVSIELDGEADQRAWDRRIALEDEVDWRAYAQSPELETVIQELSDGPLKDMAKAMQAVALTGAEVTSEPALLAFGSPA